MAAYINRVGETYNNITITKELGGGEVEGLCNVCKRVAIYNKTTLIRCDTRCKFDDCENRRRTSSDRLIDMTGITFGKLTVTKELGGGKVIARCELCKSEKKYSKQNLVAGKTKTCGCSNNYNGGQGLIDRTNQTIGGLTILKELGKGKVIVQCNTCNSTKEMIKRSVTRGLKDCGCSCGKPREGQGKFIDRVGERFNSLVITKELGKSKVLAKCNSCGIEHEYYKPDLVSKSCGCKTKGCINNKAERKLVGRVGDTYNNLQIVEEAYERKVKAKCLKCGHEDTYIKSHIVGILTSCKNCGIGRSCKRIEGHIINNIKIINYNHTGRSGQHWYICECIYCNKQELMKYEDIFNYNCGCR